MLFLTNFADLGLLLPLVGMIALALAAVGRRRDALAWSLAVICTLTTMLLLKVLTFVFIDPGKFEGLVNPSGHTAAGTVVYAGLLFLIGERFASRTILALLAGAMFSLIFGFTRLMLRVHTLEDVLVGGMVGLVGVSVIACLASPRRPTVPGLELMVLTAIACFGMLTFYGHSINAEVELQWLAAQIRSASTL
ncbi:phosphatase PAP2 family protein [Belnapia sp. T18]|uniref:Phosphatase PAP2 family protein n=1 Tax=Belnapia arida TaxID=2804533 RepID=A0ABS1UBM1_9PROT|nr:phosphatase PAP2 family protein [Belnapia arida]MBL6081082.1 phosphatase PAP2 family protein [Belnapia arida]